MKWVRYAKSVGASFWISGDNPGMRELIALNGQVTRGIKNAWNTSTKCFRSPGRATAETIAFLVPFYPLYAVPTKDSRYDLVCSHNASRDIRAPSSALPKIHTTEGNEREWESESKSEKEKERDSVKKERTGKKRNEEEMTARRDN